MAVVRQCVIARLATGRWPLQSHPARRRHGLPSLKQTVRSHLGMSWAKKWPEGFEELWRRGTCAVSPSVWAVAVSGGAVLLK